ncbi:MAG: 2-amino-4-hydroxy-6-hydroxymethyldihydropteridine diphosphokinase [Acidobacteria bacterium]|nr:2-amino-4-hydroxy-6-hydroxymethyldihydropteridine diphosphokinase [Acidobacteriota bacterium]
MPRAAIALGSNLDDRKKNLDEAARLLQTVGEVTNISSWIETDPVGYTDQPKFLNGVAILETELKPWDLMQALLNIEHLMGRDRSGGIPKGPRLIDMDILLYDGEIVQKHDLTIPHPELANRAFVLEPLAQVAGDWVEPKSGSTVRQLLEKLTANIEAAS